MDLKETSTNQINMFDGQYDIKKKLSEVLKINRKFRPLLLQY